VHLNSVIDDGNGLSYRLESFVQNSSKSPLRLNNEWVLDCELDGSVEIIRIGQDLRAEYRAHIQH